jgi:hypothetical protein
MNSGNTPATLGEYIKLLERGLLGSDTVYWCGSKPYSHHPEDGGNKDLRNHITQKTAT